MSFSQGRMRLPPACRVSRKPETSLDTIKTRSRTDVYVVWSHLEPFYGLLKHLFRASWFPKKLILSTKIFFSSLWMFSIHPSFLCLIILSLLCAHMATESVPHEYRSHTILPLSNPLTIYHTHTHTHTCWQPPIQTHAYAHLLTHTHTHTHTHRKAGLPLPPLRDRISFQRKWLKRGGREGGLQQELEWDCKWSLNLWVKRFPLSSLPPSSTLPQTTVIWSFQPDSEVCFDLSVCIFVDQHHPTVRC